MFGPIVFTIVDVFLVGLAIATWWQSLHRRFVYRATIGYVSGSGGRLTFKTDAGEKITCFSKEFGGSDDYEAGERVRILYDPQNPQQAIIQTFYSVWLAPLVVSGLAAGFICPVYRFWVDLLTK